MKDLASIRNEYLSSGLRREHLHPSPIPQFKKWMQEAIESQVEEVTAMILSTADENGQPSARVVLLKGVTDAGFKFFTNYGSHKSGAIERNPSVSLNFFWMALHRQVRIRGIATKLPLEESRTYFQSRPLGSQLGAWASAQSEVVDSRKALEERLQEIQERFKGVNPLPLPPFWGGFIVEPKEVEFWQGRENRLHDRFLYQLEDGQWKIQRLYP